jgi:hypothetical protein
LHIASYSRQETEVARYGMSELRSPNNQQLFDEEITDHSSDLAWQKLLALSVSQRYDSYRCF